MIAPNAKNKHRRIGLLEIAAQVAFVTQYSMKLDPASVSDASQTVKRSHCAALRNEIVKF